MPIPTYIHFIGLHNYNTWWSVHFRFCSEVGKIDVGSPSLNHRVGIRVRSLCRLFVRHCYLYMRIYEYNHTLLNPGAIFCMTYKSVALRFFGNSVMDDHRFFYFAELEKKGPQRLVCGVIWESADE